MESLPEAVLIRILASIPAVELVLACRLVCCHWKNLVDGAAVWILKCQQEGLAGAEAQNDTENWQNFYFLSKKRKNLIKNPCGEEDLQHWGEVENGGDGWKIEELPGDFGKEFPSEEVHKYFVTSYEWCRKAQVIDLRAEGYWEELMDTTQPKVVVKDWTNKAELGGFSPRSNERLQSIPEHLCAAGLSTLLCTVSLHGY
ncbi:F-box only protein 2-like isoform X2 [Apus apus]|uniref:F-box only protein 2-like isoform X2 n=1 Tax=Apus apus TaxID=8895 RepID=UPI0021F89143|nr:F-box only protein 2-like isoform X2 [Apus apus]